MRFEEFNPLEGKSVEEKMYQILDKDGKLVNEKDMPDLSDKDLVYLFETMLFTRIIDEKALSYQRQGRMLTYAPNTGQEAAQVASAFAMKKSDWLVPAFRELGAWLTHGATLKNIYLYWYGNEWGSHMPDVKILPVSVPIASQFQHAVGLGMSINIKDEDDVVVSYVGDGGTSQGDFHESLNFASVFNTPVVFIIQNNQYAISVPRKSQSKTKTLAQKALSYDIPGILVDGNDIFAMYVATKEAIDRARNGQGPTLIEAYTYRLGAHTTSDDPTKYREDAEVDKWREKDPIDRFRKYLEKKDLIDEDWVENKRSELEKEVMSTFEEIEKGSDTKVEDIFKYQYATMPPHLEEQLNEYEEYLEGGK
jgi:pyruvate dehydrogenase E1 component subunit alpha